MFTVYLLTNKVNGKKYVGITMRKLKHRLSDHRSAAFTAKKTYPICQALRKYGWDGFKVTVLIVTADYVKLLEFEKTAIKRLNTITPNGYNITAGGEGALGRRHSFATRLKISARAKERVLSVETKNKISISLKGRPSPTLGMKFGKAWNTGKKMSIETRAKQSTMRMGSKNPNARAFMLNDVRFGCVSEAIKETGLTRMQVIYRLQLGRNAYFIDPPKMGRPKGKSTP